MGEKLSLEHYVSALRCQDNKSTKVQHLQYKEVVSSFGLHQDLNSLMIPGLGLLHDKLDVATKHRHLL